MKKNLKKTMACLMAGATVMSVMPAQAVMAADETLEPYTIDLYMTTWGGSTDDVKEVQEAMSVITREKINADVVIHPIDIGSWGNQIPLLYSSQDKIDFIVTSANMSPNYSSMVSSGQLLPLNDLIEQYGTELKEYLGDFLNGAQISGDIYAIPVNKEKASIYGGFAFNKAMVEELGLTEQVEAITSYKDLTDILAIVHEAKPEVTAMSTDGESEPIGYMRDQYVDYYGTNIGGVMPIDTTDFQLVNLFEYEPFVEAVTWTHEMYEKGYINEDVTTGNDQSIVNGTAFCWPAKLKAGSAEDLTAAKGYEVMVVEINEPYSQADQAQGVMAGIGSTSEDPERAMMFMNLLYSDVELLNTFIYGVEGTHYEIVSDAEDSLGNKITYIKTQDGSTSGWVNQTWAYGNQFLEYLSEGKNVETYANLIKTNDRMKVSTTYATNVMTISKNYDDITLLNGTAGKKLILDLEANIETYNYKIYDCMGNVIKSSTLNSDSGINKFEVPLSGMVRLEKIKNI